MLEVFRKRAGVGVGVRGGLLHMNINLDSTKIIITGHKIVTSFFLQRFFYYQLEGLQSNLIVKILEAIFMHTSIVSA